MKKAIAALIVATLLASILNAKLAALEPHEEQRVIDGLVLDRAAALESPVHAQRLWAIRVTEPPVSPVPADWSCREWYETSILAGFEHSDWPAVGIIAWRESRCNPSAFNGTDPSGGSRGIMQVNGSWRRYLRDAGVLWDITELHDPLTNFRAARVIVQYDRDRGRCDWQQWSTRRGLC